jgi:hypothetical protein
MPVRGYLNGASRPAARGALRRSRQYLLECIQSGANRPKPCRKRQLAHDAPRAKVDYDHVTAASTSSCTKDQSMPEVETVLIKLGTAASKAIFAQWLRGRTPGARPNESVAELLRRRVPESLQRRRAQRQIDQIADQLVEQIKEFLDSEFRNVPQNEVTAASLLVGELFNDAETDAKFLSTLDLDALRLDNYLRRTGAAKIANAFLGDSGVYVFDQLLREVAAYVIEVASVMPTFSLAVYREMLRRETAFSTMVEQALAKLPTADKVAQDRSSEDAQFETEYRRSIARKLDRLELFGATLSAFSRRYALSVAYISLTVRKEPTSSDQIVESPSTSLNANEPSEEDGLEESSTQRVENALGYARQRVLISGEAGSGETTLLQWLSVMAARKEFSGGLRAWNDRIPVYLPLRRYASTKPSTFPRPEQFLDLVLPNLIDFTPRTWMYRLLKSGRALLLLDGMDELPSPSRAIFMDWLTDILHDFPDVTVVVTSRPAAVEREWFQRYEIQSFELQPMSLRDIKSFINQWHSAIAKDIKEDDELASLARFRESLKLIVDERRAIRLLATNPLMCALICALHRDRRAQLPRDRLELYRIALEMLLERRDKERQVPEREDMRLTYREKEIILQDIAYWLIRNGQSDTTISEMAIRIAKVLPHIPEVRRVPAHILSYLIERSGVLRSPTEGHIDFLHRSFQEYLAAKAAVEGSDIPLLINSGNDDQWREVIILAAGHARPNEQEILIRGLLARARSDRKNRHRLYLLAMSCMETSTQISPKLRTEVKRALTRVMPPRDVSDAAAIAATGELAIPFLSGHSELDPETVAACVHTLALIGDAYAMETIKEYARDRRQAVAQKVVECWSLFPVDEYARKVLIHAPLDRGAIDLVDGSLVDYLPMLRRLRRVRASRLSGEELRKLGCLARMLHLQINDVEVTSFDWMNGSKLETLSLSGCVIDSWEGLGGAAELRRLSVVSSSGGMEESDEIFGRLESVELARTGVTSLRFLRGAASSARSLSIIECDRLSSLEGAGGFRALEELVLEDNVGIVRIDELQQFRMLRRVTIRGNNIRDLGPLVNLPNLKVLRLDRYVEYRSLASLNNRNDLKVQFI